MLKGDSQHQMLASLCTLIPTHMCALLTQACVHGQVKRESKQVKIAMDFRGEENSQIDRCGIRKYLCSSSETVRRLKRQKSGAGKKVQWVEGLAGYASPSKFRHQKPREYPRQWHTSVTPVILGDRRYLEAHGRLAWSKRRCHGNKKDAVSAWREVKTVEILKTDPHLGTCRVTQGANLWIYLGRSLKLA